jgi:type I restriction enzyme R subunit
MKEATARIKINKLLEAAGWRFFPEQGKPANVKLEHTTTLTPDHLDSLGENFEKLPHGFIDFLLLNEKGSHQTSAPNSPRASGAMTFRRIWCACHW